ncbi:MAG: toprim domain-containing protein, partial [Planctomycetota bacterium]|nr:toprim domain-containing protein [Planctomycetota bacterium]
FGGRLIPGHKERGGKYFNSKESPVFHKSRVLYGLPNARDGIRDTNTVLVVEGYADCVACHQFGVRNVVATLGTALTELHCTRLKAFAQKVVMVYDGDDAGQNAAAKAVGMLIGQSVDLRVLTLPEGADPDDYLKQNGTEAFQNLVDKAPEAWEFRFNYEVTKHGLDSINSRETVVTEMLNLLAGASDLQGSAREDIILGRLAPRLQLTEGAIRNQLQRIRSGSRPQQFQTKPAHEEQPAVVQEERIEVHRRPLSKNDRMECELLEILLTEPELAEQTRQEIGVDDFLNPHLRELLQIVYDVVELGEVPSFERVTLEMERNELKGMTVWLADQAREKGIEHKLRENTDGGASNLLSQVLGALKWRREELSHKADFQKQAMSGEGSDALSMLQKAAAFHRKRVMNQR